MDDKELKDVLNNMTPEELESLDNCDCEDCQSEGQDGTVDDRLVQLTIEKEYDKLSRRFLFDDETIEILSKSSEFQDGVTEAMKYVGMYSALISYGFDEDKAFELVINSQNIKYNLEATEKANKASLDIAKVQNVNIEKNSL